MAVIEQGVSCQFCHAELAPPRTTYCDARCRRRAANARRQARDPRYAAKQKAQWEIRIKSPYRRWARAADQSRAVRVPLDPDSQRKARLLIENAGLCAYENAQGLICDLAPPWRPKHAGVVWSRLGDERKEWRV